MIVSGNISIQILSDEKNKRVSTKKVDISNIEIDFLNQILHEDDIINDFKINKIYENEHPDEVNQEMQELKKKSNVKLIYKVLEVETLFTKSIKHLILKDIYYSLFVDIGIQIRVIGRVQAINIFQKWDQEETQYQNELLLILEPTYIISPSHLNGIEYCHRQQCLKYYASGFEKSVPMLRGLVCHDFFEYCSKHMEIFESYQITDQNYAKHFILDQLAQAYNQHIETAYILNIEFQEFIEQNEPLCQKTFQWIYKHIYQQQTIEIGNQKDTIQILRVVETEKYIESSKYSFCGRIDCIVECLYQGTKQIIPFEIKTGKKKSITYDYQTVIYSFLMNQNQDNGKTIGMLYYMLQDECQIIKVSKLNVLHLFHYRNMMVYYLTQKLPLYCPLNACETCPLVSNCAVLSLIQNDKEIEKFKPIQDMIKPSTKTYLIKNLIELEYEDQKCKMELLNGISLVFLKDTYSLSQWYEQQKNGSQQGPISVKFLSQKRNNEELKLFNDFLRNQNLILRNDEVYLTLWGKVVQIDEKTDQLEFSVWIQNFSNDDENTLKKVKQDSLGYKWFLKRKEKQYSDAQFKRNQVIQLVVQDQHKVLKYNQIYGIQQKEEDERIKEYCQQMVQKDISIMKMIDGDNKILQDELYQLIFILCLAGKKVLVVEYLKEQFIKAYNSCTNSIYDSNKQHKSVKDFQKYIQCKFVFFYEKGKNEEIVRRIYFDYVFLKDWDQFWKFALNGKRIVRIII